VRETEGWTVALGGRSSAQGKGRAGSACQLSWALPLAHFSTLVRAADGATAGPTPGTSACSIFAEYKGSFLFCTRRHYSTCPEYLHFKKGSHFHGTPYSLIDGSSAAADKVPANKPQASPSGRSFPRVSPPVGRSFRALTLAGQASASHGSLLETEQATQRTQRTRDTTRPPCTAAKTKQSSLPAPGSFSVLSAICKPRAYSFAKSCICRDAEHAYRYYCRS
jgi:hypothetical protein